MNRSAAEADMHRYWFSFDKTPGTAWADVLRLVGGVLLGCGVTAHDRADAEALLRKVFDPDPVPPVTEVCEDVELTALDQGHVVPNMGNPAERGIWFPLGYDHTTPWRPTKDDA
jgi:hypothetical protein